MLIEFEMPADPLNLNDADGSPGAMRSRRERKKLWIDAAYWATCAAFPGSGPSGRTMPPCEVHISIPVATVRARDPHNWVLTSKAVIDGITRAGVWPDDNAAWVSHAEPTLRVVPAGRLSREKVYVRLVPRARRTEQMKHIGGVTFDG